MKSYVRNKSQPEGSIAEGYLAEEVLTFCSQYLNEIETRISRPACVDDYPDERDSSHISTLFPPIGRAIGAFSTFDLSTVEKTQAHRYVLLNCPQVKTYNEWVPQIFSNDAKFNKIYDINHPKLISIIYVVKLRSTYGYVLRGEGSQQQR